MATRETSQATQWSDHTIGVTLERATPKANDDRDTTTQADLHRLRERLLAAEARLEMATAAGELAMWDWNVLSGDICYNEQWQPLLDISAEDLLLRQSLWERLALPENHAAMMHEIERLISNEIETFQHEFELRTASGNKKWILARAQASHRSANGQATRIMGAWRDVTTAHEHSRSVEDAQRRFERAVAGTSDGLFDWDLATGYVWYAPRFRELLDYADSDFPNSFNSFQRALHPEDRIDILARVRNHLEQRTPLDVQCRLATRSGEYKWFRLRAQAERDAGGRPRRLSGSIRDINGLIHANEALNRNNDYYGTILDALPVSVGYIDSQQRIVYVNRAGCSLLSRTSQDIQGQLMQEVLVPEVYAELARCFKEAMSDGPNSVTSSKTVECQIHTHTEAGQPLDIDITFIPHRAQNSDEQGCFMLARSITKQLRLEAELRQSQKMEAIGHLTGGVAHDFNNLLSVIIGNTQLLARTLKDSPRLLKQADTVLRASLRGTELTRRLLSFARQNARQKQVVQLDKLLNEMFDLLKRVLPADIDLKLIRDSTSGAATLDAGEFENAILNLVINARDAIQNGGHIQIAARCVQFDNARQQYLPCDGVTRLPSTLASTLTNALASASHFIEVSVTDTGTGMSRETQQRVFEPFFTTKEFGKGSGLGLAMVYNFVKSSGGEIRIESQPGSGTCIRLYLPQFVQQPESQSGPQDRIHSLTTELPNGHETILVVDHDQDVRSTTVEMLQSVGYQAIAAADGHQALQALRDHNIDLLLTDVTLPGGLSTASMLKQMQQDKPLLPVLLTNTLERLTSDDLKEFASNGGVLSKPLQLTELAKRVREVLDQYTATSKLLTQPFAQSPSLKHGETHRDHH